MATGSNGQLYVEVTTVNGATLTSAESGAGDPEYRRDLTKAYSDLLNGLDPDGGRTVEFVDVTGASTIIDIAQISHIRIFHRDAEA